jgi:predicted hydrolase (HD superfamily)
MPLPDKAAATALLHAHVQDDYQRLHALMVATAMEGYAHHLVARATTDLPTEAPGLRHMQDSNPAFAASMPGLAAAGGADPHLWHVTGLLHDIDFGEHPDTHPATALRWFKDWGYPEDLIHAVEAHAYGYHDFKTLPRTKLAAALLACDEICGIFYAYRKMNPVPYGQMKPGSVRKKFKEPAFAAKIDRSVIQLGCDHLGVTLDDHIANLVRFLAPLP